MSSTNNDVVPENDSNQENTDLKNSENADKQRNTDNNKTKQSNVEQNNQIDQTSKKVDDNPHVSTDLQNAQNGQSVDTGFVNINETSENANKQEESKNMDDKHKLMPEYYDENNRLNYEQIVEQEENIRLEIERNSPLISEKFEMSHLEKEFSGSSFEEVVKDVINKYQGVRYIRRDGIIYYKLKIRKLLL
jgi:hypothetical protein